MVHSRVTRHIPEETIEEIRRAADIVTIISSRIQLKKAGSAYKAPCPFHLEKTPSFFVNPKRQIFKCFGCGKGGNVFHFLMEFEGISFIQAVRYLAEQYGIVIPASDPQERRQRSEERELYQILEWASKFFQDNLQSPQGQVARAYLQSRHIKAEMIKRFCLGFALPQWDALRRRAQRQGFSPQRLAQAGLIVSRKGREGYYDRFRNRLIFPIWDREGRVIAFGGRTLGSDMPKYLNSPENKLFAKRNTLYALHLARPHLLHTEKLVVVEGYTDVIMAHQYEIPWVVGTLGTALTPEHARLMRHQVGEVIVVFDGDSAGERAAARSLVTLLENGVMVKVVLLPEKLDPCDFLCQQGREAFVAFLDRAQDFLDFQLAQIAAQYSLDSVNGRVQAAKTLSATIKLISDPLTRQIFVDKASQKLGLSPELLFQQMTTRAPAHTYLDQNPTQPSWNHLNQKMQERDEAFLLQLMFLYPQFIERIFQNYPVSAFISPDMAKIAQLIYQQIQQHHTLELAPLLSLMDEPLRAKAVALCYQVPETHVCWGGDVEERMERIFQAYRNRQISAQAHKMKDLLSAAASRQDEDLVNQILQDLPALIRSQKKPS